jgi:hypothetical protein
MAHFTVGIMDLSIDMQDTWSLLDCARNELGSVRTFFVSRFTVFFYVTFLCWSFLNSFGGKQAVLQYDFKRKESLTTVWMMLSFPSAWSCIGTWPGGVWYYSFQEGKLWLFQNRAQKPSTFLTFPVSCSCCSFFYFFVGVFSQGMLDIPMGLRSPEIFLDSYWLKISAS